MGKMKAKKNLGQNFLIDKNVITKINNSIGAKSDDLIIEIGPGMGALTKELKIKNAHLLCYEIDNDLKNYLEPLIDSKTKIIWGDFLTCDILKAIENIKYHNLYIVGNLPYYITTPIIKRIIDLKLDIEEMVFMVQDEVADRFTAQPKSKDYGSITLFLKYYFELEKLFKVSKNSFNPVPKVESAVIMFKKRIKKPNVIEDKYFKLIKDSFKYKRKTLKNNLNGYDFSKVKEILMKYNIEENVRAEEIPEEVFIDIANNL